MTNALQRARETLERLAEDEREQRGAFAPRCDAVDPWSLPTAELVSEYPAQPARTKSHSKPERAARDELLTRGYIEKRLERFAAAMGEECGAAHRNLRQEFNTAIGELRAEISTLQGLLTAANEAARLRSELAELKSARHGAVLDLPSPLCPTSGQH
jgi:hypothetical protein